MQDGGAGLRQGTAVEGRPSTSEVAAAEPSGAKSTAAGGDDTALRSLVRDFKKFSLKRATSEKSAGKKK